MCTHIVHLLLGTSSEDGTCKSYLMLTNKTPKNYEFNTFVQKGLLNFCLPLTASANNIL